MASYKDMILKYVCVNYCVTALLSQLTGKAGISGRSRQTFNIHASYYEPCKRFLNAINIGNYIRPQRNSLDDRKEMLVACKGKFANIEFFNNGDFNCVTLFGTEKYFDKGVSFLVCRLRLTVGTL